MDIKKKRQRFNALLAAGHMLHAKRDILSGEGVDSTLDLTEAQLDRLIARVKHLVEEKETEADQAIRRIRHKCLRMISACGIDTQDWNAVNAFMMDKRVCGRHLYELNAEELVRLHHKLSAIRDNKIKQAKELKRLETEN